MAEPTPNNDEPREELVAYLDGELDPQAAEQFEQRLQRDPALRAEADALKRTWELLDFLPQPEPSATFTSKTLDKISVLRPAATSATTMPAIAPVESIIIPIEPRRRQAASWKKFLGWTAAAIAVFAVGYIVTGPPAHYQAKLRETRDPAVIEEEIARDLRILDRLPQLEVGEDMAFLKALDDPELFGDEVSGR